MCYKRETVASAWAAETDKKCKFRTKIQTVFVAIFISPLWWMMTTTDLKRSGDYLLEIVSVLSTETMLFDSIW